MLMVGMVVVVDSWGGWRMVMRGVDDGHAWCGGVLGCAATGEGMPEARVDGEVGQADFGGLVLDGSFPWTSGSSLMRVCPCRGLAMRHPISPCARPRSASIAPRSTIALWP